MTKIVKDGFSVEPTSGQPGIQTHWSRLLDEFRAKGLGNRNYRSVKFAFRYGPRNEKKYLRIHVPAKGIMIEGLPTQYLSFEEQEIYDEGIANGQFIGIEEITSDTQWEYVTDYFIVTVDEANIQHIPQIPEGHILEGDPGKRQAYSYKSPIIKLPENNTREEKSITLKLMTKTLSGEIAHWVVTFIQEAIPYINIRPKTLNKQFTLNYVEVEASTDWEVE